MLFNIYIFLLLESMYVSHSDFLFHINVPIFCFRCKDMVAVADEGVVEGAMEGAEGALLVPPA